MLNIRDDIITLRYRQGIAKIGAILVCINPAYRLYKNNGEIIMGLRLLVARLTVAVLTLGAECAVQASAFGIDELMPQPAQVRQCEGSLAIPPIITYRQSSGSLSNVRLAKALSRLSEESDITFQPADAALLELTIVGTAPNYPGVDTDESYRLHIQGEGIQLSAATEYGALHGLTTLSQLLKKGKTLPCVSIVDRPRYAWRGLSLDVVRHWMPVDVVKRQIDVMARYKMNVLHWHLTDDQSFRVESLKYPALHEKGSDGNYYTQAQIRDVVEYAADRGVRVVPEFDLPGHSRSWQMAFPQLSSVPGKTYYLYHQDGIFSDPLDPTREGNLELIAGIIAERRRCFPIAISTWAAMKSTKTPGRTIR